MTAPYSKKKPSQRFNNYNYSLNDFFFNNNNTIAIKTRMRNTCTVKPRSLELGWLELI